MHLSITSRSKVSKTVWRFNARFTNDDKIDCRLRQLMTEPIVRNSVSTSLIIKDTVTRLCACAAFWFMVCWTVFQVFGRGTKSLSIVPFRLEPLTSEHRWNLEKGVLDHLWAILSKGRKKKTKKKKKKKTVGWGSQKDNCGERRTWNVKCERECMCVFVGHGLRSTSFVLAKETKIRICPTRTSLTARTSWTSLPAFVNQVLEQLQETFDYANCKETSTNYQ